MAEFTLTDFEPIVPGVWRAVADPEAVTIGLVAGETGCLVVDTGSSPAQGRAIRAAAEATAGVPVVGAVVTHAHHDHLFGLAAFADVATYGHESIAAALAGDALAADADRLGVAREELVAPNRPFALGDALDLGGRYVEVVRVGPGHSPSDTIVLVPDAGVVFVGDLLEEAADPAFGPDSDPQRWATALDGVLPALTAHPRVVLGHGAVVDRVFARRQRDQIEMTWAQLDYLYTQGTPAADVPSQGEWPFSADTMAALVPVAYDLLRASGRAVESRTLPLLNADQTWRS